MGLLSYLGLFSAVFATFAVRPAQLQGCAAQLSDYKTFNETDEPGLKLMTLSDVAGSTWNFTVAEPSASLNSYFRLDQSADGDNITLVLNQTFDLERVYEQLNQVVTSIRMRFTCSGSSSPISGSDWYATVDPVNEFTPTFAGVPADGFNVSEDSPLRTVVVYLKGYVRDQDVQPNPTGFDFELNPYSDPAEDGRANFIIDSTLTGALAVNTKLDYEAMPPGRNYYMLNVTVDDREGLRSQTLIRINVLDADDQPPEFYYPQCTSPCFPSYTAAIRADFTGPITWLEPAALQARDRDTLGSKVLFNIKKGEPASFFKYLTIDQITGVVSVIAPVEDTNATSFLLIVEAVENTIKRNSEQTTLWLLIEGRNRTLPTLPPEPTASATDSSRPFYVAVIILAVLLGALLAAVLIFIIVVTLCKRRKPSPILPTSNGVISPGSLGPVDEDSKKPVNARRGQSIEDSGSYTTGRGRRRNSNDSRMEFMQPPSHEYTTSGETLSTARIAEDRASLSREQATVTTAPPRETQPMDDQACLADQDQSGLSNSAFQPDSGVASLESLRTRV